jgi:hypothetical protein
MMPGNVISDALRLLETQAQLKPCSSYPLDRVPSGINSDFALLRFGQVGWPSHIKPAARAMLAVNLHIFLKHAGLPPM